MDKNKKRTEIRRLYKLIRENLKEFKDLENAKTPEEIDSIRRWCGWIYNDCRKLLELKIPEPYRTVEEWRNTH